MSDSRRRLPSRKRVRIRIIHQLDPDGLIPGGIPTFISGLVKAAPSDIQISIVGLTTDDERRPVGKWSTLERNGRTIPFFPVARDHNPGTRSSVPLSVKMTAGVSRYLHRCSADCDVLDFHRFEAVLPFVADRRPKNVFVHQNMEVIRNANTDIKWKHAPAAYFALERFLVPKCASVFCVRADAVSTYRDRFPGIADRIQFTPTWMDPDTFHPGSADQKNELRTTLLRTMGISREEELLLWVGRLDRQKNPLLLVDAFARVHAERPGTRLIIVGDGVLRPEVAARLHVLGLADAVTFAGLRKPQEVAGLLQVARAFLLTSAYEGMPMALLEALGCGVPVVTTDVGEIRRVVRPGLNGEVADDHSPEGFAKAALQLLSQDNAGRAEACVASVREYVPSKVLEPVFENYRTLAYRGL